MFMGIRGCEHTPASLSVINYFFVLFFFASRHVDLITQAGARTKYTVSGNAFILVRHFPPTLRSSFGKKRCQLCSLSALYAVRPTIGPAVSNFASIRAFRNRLDHSHIRNGMPKLHSMTVIVISYSEQHPLFSTVFTVTGSLH